MWCSDACGALIGFEVRPWMHTEYVVDYQFGVPSHVCGEVMSRCIFNLWGLECFALALFYVIKLCPWYDSSPDPSSSRSNFCWPWFPWIWQESQRAMVWLKKEMPPKEEKRGTKRFWKLKDAMDAMDDDSFEKTCSKTKHIPYHISEPSKNSLSESLYFCFQSVLLGIWGEPKKIWLPDSRAPECYDFIFHFLLASNSKFQGSRMVPLGRVYNALIISLDP